MERSKSRHDRKIFVKKYNHLVELLSQTDLVEKTQITRLSLTEEDQFWASDDNTSYQTESKMTSTNEYDGLVEDKVTEMDQNLNSAPSKKTKEDDNEYDKTQTDLIEETATTKTLSTDECCEQPNSSNTSFETGSIITTAEEIEVDEKAYKVVKLDHRLKHHVKLVIECFESSIKESTASSKDEAIDNLIDELYYGGVYLDVIDDLISYLDEALSLRAALT